MVEPIWHEPKHRRPAGATPNASLATVEAAPRARLQPKFAIDADVWSAAAAWPTTQRVRVDAVCACGQSIAKLAEDGLSVCYSEDQLTGLAFAHLVQAHGWTRETIGDRAEDNQ